MAEMPKRTVLSQDVMDCPVCRVPITFRFHTDLALQALTADGDHVGANITAKVIGVEIAHTCSTIQGAMPRTANPTDQREAYAHRHPTERTAP